MPGLFTSDREEQGQRLYGGAITDYDELIRQIMSQPDFFGDVNTTQDVGRKFGISSDVSGVYNPLRRNLSTQLARSRSAAASRRGNSATPEYSFLPAEQDYFSALGGLESSEAGAKIGREDTIANLLRSVLGERQQFGAQKLGMKGSALGGKQGAIGNYLGSLSGSSLFDDLLSLGGTAASIATGAGFNPFKGKAKANTSPLDKYYGGKGGVHDEG